MTLQQQVQQHLDSTGISLRELSRRSGVSHTTIGKILRGGTYKSDTANDLIFAMSFYGGDTAQPVMQDKAAETLDATVEQLAAQRVNADLTHHADWDTDLQCAKYRRVMALEKELEQSKAEVGIVREQRNKLGFACEQLTADLEAEKRNFAALEQVHEHREQHLKSCENALIEADQKLNDANTAWVSLNTQHGTTTQQLRDANAEIKRLTALSETHGQSWKAASVQVEQLQKQLDHGQAKYNELWSAHRDWEKDEAEMLAQIDTLFAERETTATLHDQQVIRLRVYVWILVAALVFVVASGLVVWGAK